MSRVEMNATELTDTDVSFVALVKRGANRLPFRITKGDADMIDLHAIGRKLFQKAETPSSIAAVVAQKSDPELLAKLSAAAGLGDNLKKSEEDEIVTVKKEDSKLDGAVLVKLDTNYAVMVKGSHVKKACGSVDFSDTIFAPVDGRDGFYAGPALARRIYKAHADSLMKAELNPGQLADALKKAADDFSLYLQAIASLPETVAKTEAVLRGVGTGNAQGGAGMDQETGDGLGDQANRKGATQKASSLGRDLAEEGDPGAADPLMPPKNAAIGTRAAKADAGKNGTGAGFEEGEGTGTTPRATEDDAANTEVDAKPGKRVSGDNSGMPADAQAPTKKFDGDGDHDDAMVGNDDSTNGAQSMLNPKLQSPTDLGGTHMAKAAKDLISLAKSMGYKVETSGDGSSHVITITDVEPQGESQAGEGAAQDPDKRPEDTATADDAKNAGGKVTGKVKGNTLDMSGVPRKAQSPTDTGGVHTAKNDGDADIGRKGKGKQLPDEQSGSGAQQADVQTLKSDTAIMQAIQALSKSVRDEVAAVTKSVAALSQRVDGVTEMARKNDAALNGTVFNEEREDRDRTIKAEAGTAIPLLDTAYSRRRA